MSNRGRHVLEAMDDGWTLRLTRLRDIPYLSTDDPGPRSRKVHGGTFVSIVRRGLVRVRKKNASETVYTLSAKGRRELA